MSNILYGKVVADKIDNETTNIVQKLVKKNKKATIALIQVGNNNDDNSYKKAIINKAKKLSINVKEYNYSTTTSQEQVIATIHKLNQRSSIHGILVFRPLPNTLNQQEICNEIDLNKDIDCCSETSLGNIFANNNITFTPCTAQAVMETLNYYHIDLEGKNVLVIGRSLVIGKPLSQLLLNKNATVTIAHSKTQNLKDICQNADIVISCIGKSKYLDEQYVNKNHTIIDVGINYDEKTNSITGDFDFDKVQLIVENITPVPKGIGSITNSILLNRVASNALEHHYYKTKTLTIQAMLIALYFVLAYFSFKITPLNIKLTLEALATLIAGLLLGPFAGFCVGFFGSLIYQLIGSEYGPSITTLIWVLPHALSGLMIGLYGKNKKYISFTNCLFIAILSAISVTVLNIIASYLDSYILKYPYSLNLITVPIKIIVGVVLSIIFSLILPKLIKTIRKIIH